MEEEVYEYLLANAVGYDNRVKAKVLMQKFNVEDHKTFRSIIEELRLDKDKRIIGSEAGKSGGYFICTTDEEVKKTLNHFKHRAGQMYKIAYVIESKVAKAVRA